MASEVSDKIKQARQEAGLTQEELATISGVARSLIARYETGVHQPTASNFLKLLNSCKSKTPSYCPPWEMTTSTTVAGSLIKALEVSGSHGGLGVVREWVNEFWRTPNWARPDIIDPEPHLFEERWDALLAGVAEHLAFRGRLRVPRWTMSSSRFLDYGWWVVDLEGLHGVVMRDTPPALMSRNVFLDRGSLESI